MNTKPIIPNKHTADILHIANIAIADAGDIAIRRDHVQTVNGHKVIKYLYRSAHDPGAECWDIMTPAIADAFIDLYMTAAPSEQQKMLGNSFYNNWRRCKTHLEKTR